MTRKMGLLLAGAVWLGVACAAPAAGVPGVAQEPSGPLIVVSSSEESLTTARLADPRTLEDLPGFESLELGNHFVGALSPDGGAWAVITYPDYFTYGGELHIVDVANWTLSESLFEFRTGEILTLRYSPDGTHLVVVQKRWGNLERGSEVSVLAAGDGQEIMRVVVDMAPDALHFSPDGQTLYLYGQRESFETGFSAPPQVAALDLAGGELLWALNLENVKDGVYAAPELTEPQDGDQYGAFAEHYQPGVVFSSDARWLYVVHTDGQTLTRVDLNNGTVQAEPIAERLALFEQLLYLTARPAYAKGPLSGQERVAVISPDGARLYVSGFSVDVALLETERPNEYDVDTAVTAAALSVLDVRTGERIAELDTLYPYVNLSPDGAWLALTPSQQSKSVFAYQGLPEEEWLDGYQLVDAHTLEVAADLPAHGMLFDVTFSPDGSRLYVSWTRPQGGRTLQVVNTETGAVLATREFEWWQAEVLLP